MVKHNCAWSDSKYNVYLQCIRRFYYQYITKLPQTPNPNMLKGRQVHKKGEDYLKDVIKRVPKEYSYFSDHMKEFKRMGALSEHNLVISRKFTRLGNRDFSANVLLRAIVDVYVELGRKEGMYVDFKTGNMYEDKALQQSEISAVALYAAYGMDKLTTEFWYLEKNDFLSFEFTARQIQALSKKWKKAFEKADKKILKLDIEKEKQWPCSTSGLCNYCDFGAWAGGPCVHGVEGPKKKGKKK